MQIECVSWSGASASEVNGLGNGCNESPHERDDRRARRSHSKVERKNKKQKSISILSTGINKRFSFLLGGVARVQFNQA